MNTCARLDTTDLGLVRYNCLSLAWGGGRSCIRREKGRRCDADETSFDTCASNVGRILQQTNRLISKTFAADLAILVSVPLPRIEGLLPHPWLTALNVTSRSVVWPELMTTGYSAGANPSSCALRF